jgi:hypothetical protein
VVGWFGHFGGLVGGSLKPPLFQDHAYSVSQHLLIPGEGWGSRWDNSPCMREHFISPLWSVNLGSIPRRAAPAAPSTFPIIFIQTINSRAKLSHHYPPSQRPSMAGYLLSVLPAPQSCWLLSYSPKLDSDSKLGQNGSLVTGTGFCLSKEKGTLEQQWH